MRAADASHAVGGIERRATIRLRLSSPWTMSRARLKATRPIIEIIDASRKVKHSSIADGIVAGRARIGRENRHCSNLLFHRIGAPLPRFWSHCERPHVPILAPDPRSPKPRGGFATGLGCALRRGGWQRSNASRRPSSTPMRVTRKYGFGTEKDQILVTSRHYHSTSRAPRTSCVWLLAQNT